MPSPNENQQHLPTWGAYLCLYHACSPSSLNFVPTMGTIASRSGEHSPYVDLDRNTPAVGLDQKAATRALLTTSMLTPLILFPHQGIRPDAQRSRHWLWRQRAREKFAYSSPSLSSTGPSYSTSMSMTRVGRRCGRRRCPIVIYGSTPVVSDLRVSVRCSGLQGGRPNMHRHGSPSRTIRGGWGLGYLNVHENFQCT